MKYEGMIIQQMIKAGRRVKEAGLILSVTVILGIGGVERSIEHALNTAKIQTDIDPDYVGALTLMLVPGTPLHNDYRQGLFVLPDAFGFLRELFLIIQMIDHILAQGNFGMLRPEFLRAL